MNFKVKNKKFRGKYLATITKDGIKIFNNNGESIVISNDDFLNNYEIIGTVDDDSIIELNDLFMERVRLNINKLNNTSKELINSNHPNYKNHIRKIDGELQGYNNSINILNRLVMEFSMKNEK